MSHTVLPAAIASVAWWISIDVLHSMSRCTSYHAVVLWVSNPHTAYGCVPFAILLADYQRYELNGRTVLEFDVPLNHAKARERCKREGGDLFAPYTAQENDWLVARFSHLPGDELEAWIGMGPLNNVPSLDTGRYVWYRTGQKPFYSAWVPGQPDLSRQSSGDPRPGNAGDQEVCVDVVIHFPPADFGVFRGFPGGWDDADCGNKKPFACEVWSR
jgi:hypothetical protein